MLNQLIIRPCRACLVLIFCVAISVEIPAAAKSNPDHLLLEQSSAGLSLFPFPGLPFLDFYSIKPRNFVWFPDQRPASDNMDKYGVFNSVALQTLGYDPGNRDHLEIQILTAKIKPEKVARALDYARLFATEWASAPTAMKSYGRDRADVFSVTTINGFVRFERVGVWRRGIAILVVRASYTQDRTPEGKVAIIEIKTGDAQLSLRQSEIFPQIRNGDAIPTGKVANQLGLTPGIALKDQGYPDAIPIFEQRFPGVKK